VRRKKELMRIPSKRKSTSKSSGFGAPVERIFAILNLTAERGMITTGDIVRTLDIPKATAHRLVTNLEAFGLLRQTPFKGKYGAAPKLVTFATSLFASNPVYLPIKTLLLALTRKTGESHSINLYSNGEVEYFDGTEISSSVWQIRTGHKSPLHCSGAGQVFLAAFDDENLDRFLKTGPWEQVTPNTLTTRESLYQRVMQVRKQEYTIADSEYTEGIIIGSVPIKNNAGKVVAALGMRVTKPSCSVTKVAELIPTMQAYANRIGKLL
jgi:DNA-binding IclR family transcriptional regulator